MLIDTNFTVSISCLDYSVGHSQNFNRDTDRYHRHRDYWPQSEGIPPGKYANQPGAVRSYTRGEDNLILFSSLRDPFF